MYEVYYCKDENCITKNKNIQTETHAKRVLERSKFSRSADDLSEISSISTILNWVKLIVVNQSIDYVFSPRIPPAIQDSFLKVAKFRLFHSTYGSR